jgi:hypothetical protein
MNKYLKWMLIAFAIFAVLFAAGCAKTAFEEGEQSSKVVTSRPVLVEEPMPFDVGVDYVDVEYAEGYAEPAIYRKDYGDEYYEPYEPPYGSGEDVDVELKIIRTANMRIEVEDFFIASYKVETYAKKYGGYVSNSDARADHNNKHSGTVTIRVPEIHFDAVIAELSLLGEIKSKNTGGNDVTEEYVDLKSRVGNYEVHEERLLQMYDNATNVNEMMQIENQLTRVRENIERMEGRLRYFDNKVDMSTISVYLYEPTPVVKEWGIWKSIKRALNHSLATLRWMIEFLGIILPLLVAGMLVWLIVRLVRRGKKVSLRKR